MNVTDMIDRYVNEVGQHLPRKSRLDIEMELRSLLHDALDEQSDGEPSPKIAASILREFGHPKEVAAKYRPDEVLIGSQLFPTYRMVITIVLSVIGGLHLLGLLVGLWGRGMASFVDVALPSVFSFWETALTSAGIVTLIFAVIERMGGDSLSFPVQVEKEWDPYALPPVKDPDRINRVEFAAGIFFGLVFIVWLNFFPNWFGPITVAGESTGVFTLLAPEFLRHVPWVTASWLLDMLLKTAVFFQGRWNRVTRWLELAVGGFGLYIIYQIFISEAISTVPFFTALAKGGFAIVFVIVVIDLANKLFRLLIRRPFTPKNIFKSKLA